MVRYSRIRRHRRKGLNVRNYVRHARKRTAKMKTLGNSHLDYNPDFYSDVFRKQVDIGKGFSGRSEPVVDRVSISHKRLPIIENGRIIGWEQG